MDWLGSLDLVEIRSLHDYVGKVTNRREVTCYAHKVLLANQTVLTVHLGLMGVKMCFFVLLTVFIAHFPSYGTIKTLWWLDNKNAMTEKIDLIIYGVTHSS